MMLAIILDIINNVAVDKGMVLLDKLVVQEVEWSI